MLTDKLDLHLLAILKEGMHLCYSPFAHFFPSTLLYYIIL